MSNVYQAQLRASQHYLAKLHDAGELYDKGGEALRQGLALADAEWSNVEGRQLWVEKHYLEDDEAAKLCSDYPDAAPRLLDLRQHPRERIRWLETALNATRILKDAAAEGRHLNYLGLAYSRLGDTARAIEQYNASLTILRKVDDRRVQGEVLSNIGIAYANLGAPSLALVVLEQALTIARELEDFRSEGIVLCNLGRSYYLMHEFRRAIDLYEQSLTITRSIGYLPGEHTVLNHLGKIYASLNIPDRAIEFYEQALTIARDIRDRHGVGNALGNLGQVYHFTNDVNRAIEFYNFALGIAREIGDQVIEVDLLNNLGEAYIDANAPTLAFECYTQRRKITREIGHHQSIDVEPLFDELSIQKAASVTSEIPITKQETTASTITWLHISDVHFRETSSYRYDADIVIESLLKDIGKQLQKDALTPDFIVMTGDLAFSGQPAQYNLAREFFDELLNVTGLSRKRLFIVPGNHDVNREVGKQGAIAYSKSATDRHFTNAVLGSQEERQFLFARFKGYGGFFNEYFKGHLAFDHDRYFYVHPLDIGGRRVAILGLNSAWLSVSDEDEILKLVIGDRQTRDALKEAKKTSADLSIALLHHPLDWIRGFDHSDSVASLITNCDFILHGHLHKPEIIHLSNPDGGVTIIPGGACYDTREFPNSYNFVRLDLGSNTGKIYFREYVDRQGGFWTKGVRLYKNAEDGIYEFTLPSR